MRDRELRRVIGQIVVAAIPTLALTTACRTTGEATYVVRSQGRTCREACATLEGSGNEGSWQVADVMECVEATELEPGVTAPARREDDEQREERERLSTPVAVCRMRTRYMGGIGRRPEGLLVGDARGARPEGAFFARVEQLERAAVIAFERTARELSAHGAPSSLVRAVERARREELAHVEIAARWRHAFGGELGAVVSREPLTTRSLVELARENATEGCVHEHWGAILAAVQAASVQHGPLAGDLATIARDEASHAALSLRIDRWVRTRLTAAERRAIEVARAGAVAEVAASLAEVPDDLVVIGWPGRDAQTRLFHASCEALAWREAA